MLNWELLKNPLNWLIVIFMLMIAGMGATLICNHFGGSAIKSE